LQDQTQGQSAVRLGHKYGLAFGQDADKSKKSNVYSTFSSVCSKGFSITMSRSREHLLFAGRFLRQLYSNCQRICIQNHNGWPGNDTSMFVIILSEEWPGRIAVILLSSGDFKIIHTQYQFQNPMANHEAWINANFEHYPWNRIYISVPKQINVINKHKARASWLWIVWVSNTDRYRRKGTLGKVYPVGRINTCALDYCRPGRD